MLGTFSDLLSNAEANEHVTEFMRGKIGEVVKDPVTAEQLANIVRISEHNVDLIAAAITHMYKNGLETIEPTRQAEDGWMDLIYTVSQRTLLSKAKTWYVGANVKDKPQELSLFTGGFHKYREQCAAAVPDSYRGFVFEGVNEPVAAWGLLVGAIRDDRGNVSRRSAIAACCKAILRLWVIGANISRMNTEMIRREALALSVQERAELAEQLLSSLDALSEAEIEQLWFQEAARRAVEIDQGLAQRIPADEVRCQAQALLK